MVEKTQRQYRETVEFLKQLLRLIVTVAFLGGGAYNIYLGRQDHSNVAKAAALLFVGIVVGVYGFIELYKTLVRKVA